MCRTGTILTIFCAPQAQSSLDDAISVNHAVIPPKQRTFHLSFTAKRAFGVWRLVTRKTVNELLVARAKSFASLVGSQ
jgi:hypothetical protein